MPDALWDTANTMVSGAQYIADNAWPTLQALGDQVWDMIQLLAQVTGQKLYAIAQSLTQELSQRMAAIEMGLPAADTFGSEAFREHIQRLIELGGHPRLATPNPYDPNDPMNNPDWCDAMVTGARALSESNGYFEFLTPQTVGAESFLTSASGFFSFGPTGVPLLSVTYMRALQRGTGSICKFLSRMLACGRAHGLDSVRVSLTRPENFVLEKMVRNFGEPLSNQVGTVWNLQTEGFMCVDGLESGTVTQIHYLP
ncbi:MAG: hypothetical protein IPJ88_01845 [Myxococcales bacterium]|nr:MAG: hypothetical protein IPJ88_01845 [Myxococcales bacterium]